MKRPKISRRSETRPYGRVSDPTRNCRKFLTPLRSAPRLGLLFIPCPPPSGPIGRVAPTVRPAWPHIPDAPSRTPTGT